MSELIAVEVEDRICHIRFNRPSKKNALTPEMYDALADAVLAATEDDQVRCLLFTGADGVFCSGNDVAGFTRKAEFSESVPVIRFMRALSTFPKASVAAVRGPAVGIGSTLLLHCDLVYAAPEARFAFPFVNLGICPEFAASLLMPRMMGHQRASELLLLAEPFDAATASEYGIVNALIDDTKLEAHALSIAQKLADKPPAALRTTKSLLKRWTNEQVQEAISVEAPRFMTMLGEAEAKEAVSAFLDKRKPDFSRFT